MLATGAFFWISVGPASSETPERRSKASPEPGPVESVSPVPEAPLVFDHPGDSKAAFGAFAKIPIYDSAGGGQTKTLDNPTVEGMQLVFGVLEDRGDWLKVRLPVRPNGATGWVRRDVVQVKSVPNHIVIEVAKRKLSAFKGDKLLMEVPVGVGTAKTPTPIGNFYVDFSVRNPGSPYGAHMLSVAGFSNVLRNFGGGVGQIAIHGWGDDGSVGARSSNGCLRLLNKDVLKLAGMVAPGTPVFVVP
ncbi:hypothetical protein BH23ACT12_BH23ACT12_15450 [soil metagenome]